jgi:hypothetical protein
VLILRTFAFTLSIFFALGGMVPNSDFSQLTKIGFVLRHFSDHLQRASQTDFDFFDFIALHYFNADNHLENHKEENHGQLPMHSLGGHLLLWSICETYQSVHHSDEPHKEKTKFAFLNSSAEGFHLSLFRPPSMA